MKRILCLLLLACAGCSGPIPQCPHYFVVTEDGKNISVFFESASGVFARINDYTSIKEADEAAKDMNKKIGSNCK